MNWSELHRRCGPVHGDQLGPHLREPSLRSAVPRNLRSHRTRQRMAMGSTFGGWPPRSRTERRYGGDADASRPARSVCRRRRLGQDLGHDLRGCRSRAPVQITHCGPLGRFSPCAGSGCHLSADIALSRALTEAAQSRLTVIAGSRDDLFRSTYEPVKDAPPNRERPPTLRFRERRRADSARPSTTTFGPRCTGSPPPASAASSSSSTRSRNSASRWSRLSSPACMNRRNAIEPDAVVVFLGPSLATTRRGACCRPLPRSRAMR